MNVNLSIAHEIIRMALRSEAIQIAPNYDSLLECKKGKTLLLNNKGKHLAKLKEWKMLIPGFVKLINSQNIKYDYIVGTATAGIPWATLLAHELNAHHCVLEETQLIEIGHFTHLDTTKASQCDVIACNAPLGIPLGMTLAKLCSRPLVYIRQADHPYGKIVEGDYTPSQTAYFVQDSFAADTSTGRSEKLLHHAGLNVISGYGRSQRTVVTPKNKRFLLIDDLLTNGGSFDEVTRIRELGGTVEHMLVLFDQSSALAAAKKKTLAVHVHPIVTLEDIFDIATKEGYLKPGLAQQYAKDIYSGKEFVGKEKEVHQHEKAPAL